MPTAVQYSPRPADFAAWRDAARRLLAADVPPHAVDWQDGGDKAQGLFDAMPLPSEPPPGFALRVPASMLQQLQRAACFRAADRWAVLYKVLWRWTHGERDAMSPADADGARLAAMTKAVNREIHHLHAYVRFRERTDALEDGPQFVAWFEPAHDVLRAASPHFVHRMGKARWVIATPYLSAIFDGSQLQFGPGMQKPADIDDAGEALWLSYYRNTFNPSRVNPEVMRSHMPARFWKNLPEAPLIPQLVTAANAGSALHGQSKDVGSLVNTGHATVIRVSEIQAQPKRPDMPALDACRRCDLWRNATHGVPGAGPTDARIIIVGEQPGDEEDLQGRPFIGPAGAVLDDALAEAGIDRDSVYVTNAVKHFKWEPRGKRRMHKTPSQREIEACNHWLENELATVQAGTIVTLGASALKAVIRSKSVALAELIGHTLEHEGRIVVPTYHPSYVLRLHDPVEKTAARQAIAAALTQAKRTGRSLSNSTV